MEGIVDAVTGEVLSFVDTVDYLQAVGDVYPFSNDGKDQSGSLQDAWPMPFMKVGTSTTFTSTGGNFDLVGTQTGKLSGKYVEVSRMCAFNTSISKHFISSPSHILMTPLISPQTTKMRDLCGTGYTVPAPTPISYGVAEITSSNGFDFGGSGGTDCTTPGFGNAANTHSSRSGYYEVS
jgi:hypothetical protein